MRGREKRCFGFSTAHLQDFSGGMQCKVADLNFEKFFFRPKPSRSITIQAAPAMNELYEKVAAVLASRLFAPRPSPGLLRVLFPPPHFFHGMRHFLFCGVAVGVSRPT